MKETGKRQFVVKKAYEISYAVFRVSSRTANAALKEHLERQALSLLDAAAVENYAWVSTVSKAIEYLVKFGSDIGILHEHNAEMIIAQLDAMNIAIAGLEKSGEAEEIFLGDIFSNHESLFPQEVVPAAPRRDVASNIQQQSAQPGIRQTAIIDKIRQSGNCRIKDIQDILPDCSERTIRYDLQSLVEQNLIERVGSGPSVSYRIRQNASVAEGQ